MNTKLKKYLIVIIPVLIIASLISCFMYFWLRKNPIWQVEGIPFNDKLKMANHTTFIFPYGETYIRRIYFLKANIDVTFVVIVRYQLFDGYKQELYYKGNLVTWTYLDEKPINRNIRISLFHIISTDYGHYWLLRSPDEDGDVLLWCDSKYSHFSSKDTKEVVHDIIKYGDAVYTSRRGKDKLLLIALNSAYNSGDWQSFMLLSDLLLQCDKSKYANIVNHYASGSFSSRERRQNARSKITEDAVVAYAKKMKAKYKL